MRDIEIIDENGCKKEVPFHEKMHYIWDRMKEGDNVPTFILYAGKTASESQGLNAEIQTIAHDKKKIDCAYLFRVNGAQLVSYQYCFTNVRDVINGETFIIEAEKVIDALVHQKRLFYIYTGQAEK